MPNEMYEHVQAWLRRLCHAWMVKDVPAAVDLFSECKVYKETPFAENAALKENGIRELWEEIHDQSDIKVQSATRAMDAGNICVEYSLTYLLDGCVCESSGIWIIGFRNSACISFEQWFMSRPG